jgi:hypothetical protein
MYQVFVRGTAEELEKAVNAAIAEGMKPQGGVSVAVLHHQWENERKGYTESSTDYSYVQAMVDA